MADKNVTVELPEKLEFLFKPSRYKVAHGGRGGSKSWGFARALIACAYNNGRERILCTREYQNSIQESVHKLLSDQIELMRLSGFFTINRQSITGKNGSEFIFGGLKTDPQKIKSTEGVTKCWVEEAQKVSKASWDILIPTIRTENSEIWVSFNADLETDPTYKMFVTTPPPHATVIEINWIDNPWFPETLRLEKDYLASVDMEAYEHVWGGKCRKHSKAQILAGKYVVREFEPGLGWHGPYLGADWGFSIDPSVLTRSWLFEETLYVEHEYWGVGVDIDVLPEKFDTVPESRCHVIRADSARPETISYMAKKGFNIKGAVKWKGSIEDGIAHLRRFRQIVIHPRCVHTAEEARLYSYKIDKITQDVLPEVVDKHNNCWDSIRYAIEPMIRGQQGFFADCDLGR